MMPFSPPPPTPPSLAINDEDLLPLLIKTSPPPGAVTPPDSASSSDSEHRARSRSRSPTLTRSSWKTLSEKTGDHLAPPSFGGLSVSNAGTGTGGGLTGWRSISRSPSPMGLIPIHKTFSSFVSRCFVLFCLRLDLTCLSLDQYSLCHLRSTFLQHTWQYANQVIPNGFRFIVMKYPVKCYMSPSAF